jgi:hypothetical protein
VPEWGDVPAWVQGAAEAGALYMAVRGRRQKQAIDWARILKELSGLSDEEFRRAIEDHPVIAELVGRAWEAAAETASEDKRRLLAKVVAATLRGDSDALVDDAPFLLRTVVALEPAHVALLVVIATPRLDETRSANPWEVDRKEMMLRWKAPEYLLHPALAALEREGLVDGKRGLGGGVGHWTLHPYGTRFFQFLKEAGEVNPTN